MSIESILVSSSPPWFEETKIWYKSVCEDPDASKVEARYMNALHRLKLDESQRYHFASCGRLFIQFKNLRNLRFHGVLNIVKADIGIVRNNFDELWGPRCLC